MTGRFKGHILSLAVMVGGAPSSSIALDLSKGEEWRTAISSIVRDSDVTILGEGHGNLGHLQNYQFLVPAIQRLDVDTLFFEWIYDHKQKYLDAYLSDAEASANSIKEAYYICILARNHILDRGPKGTFPTFKKFVEQFAEAWETPQEVTMACDRSDGMLDLIRRVRDLKQTNANLKVCAIDYWDYDDRTDLSIAQGRKKSIPIHLQRFFRRTPLEGIRELILSANTIECIASSKKAVGIVGGYHTHERMMIGAIRKYFNKKKTVRSILMLSASLNQTGNLDIKNEACRACFDQNLPLQQAMGTIKGSIIVKPSNLSQMDRHFISRASPHSFPLTNDYLVFQAPRLNHWDILPVGTQELERKLRAIAR